MDTTWVLAANAGRSRIFAIAAGGAPEEIDDRINDAVRQRDSDLETDRFGPTSAGKSMHNTGGALPNKTYQPAQTPVQHETELFARSIAEFLLQGHLAAHYSRLVLAASPEFLGVMRQLLDPRVAALVVAELNKDYTHSSPAEPMQQIETHRAK